ncbi:MAG: aldehyde dehydrogenase [Blastopirellula sp.]|nr:aldehyde dehydrogenase [Blastopirellula sp.]
MPLTQSVEKILNYIGGELVAPQEGGWLDNFEPATGAVYSQVPDSSAADVERAVAAAQAAFPGWSQLSFEARASYLFRIADLIDRDMSQLVEAESMDNGKPLKRAAEVDIPRSSKNFRFYAGAVLNARTEAYTSPQVLNVTLRQPLGVVTCISPWNLPLYLLTWKVAPALLMGNCVIAKPSEVTPLTAYLLAQLCREAGLPAGVFNIVHGSGGNTGNAIIGHPGIKAVSFTGGTRTGRHIASVVAPQFKKLSLELGGKNPNLIFADCDYDKMLATTLRSSFANQGQICLCGSRIYVERGIYGKFRDDFVERSRRLKVGDPRLAETDLGAVVSRVHQEKILGAIERAKAEGGKVLCGGGPAEVGGRCSGGYFVQPTVIEGLSEQCATNQEEIFGPVVTLQPFDREEEAVALANATQYGLSSSLWTRDLSRAMRVAERIEAGVVWVNGWMVRDLRTPFGGVKQSGVGREGGDDALSFWIEKKNVCISY